MLNLHVNEWEDINTCNGILSVANFVFNYPRDKYPRSLNTIHGYRIGGYNVHLPSRGEGWDYQDILYALWLCNNENKFVTLHYTKEDCYERLGGDPYKSEYVTEMSEL